jgi:hypothetical protein
MSGLDLVSGMGVMAPEPPDGSSAPASPGRRGLGLPAASRRKEGNAGTWRFVRRSSLPGRRYR